MTSKRTRPLTKARRERAMAFVKAHSDLVLEGNFIRHQATGKVWPAWCLDLVRDFLRGQAAETTSLWDSPERVLEKQASLTGHPQSEESDSLTSFSDSSSHSRGKKRRRSQSSSSGSS